MKKNILAKLLIPVLLFLLTAPLCAAQDAQTPPPNQPNTEVMGEDDRLPFMQNQESQAVPETSSGGLLVKTLGAMLLVVGLIFGGAWGAKKLGFGNLSSANPADDLQLKILTSVSLGSGRTISTVRFGERILLVGSTTQSFTLLAEEETKMAETSLLGSRSVAELLDDDRIHFDLELEKAAERLDIETGGQNL